MSFKFLLTMMLIFLLLQTTTPLSYSLNGKNERPRKWDFNEIHKWRDLAYTNGNLVRLMVGINHHVSETFLKLEKTASKYFAKIVNRVSINDETVALTVEIPQDKASLLATELYEHKLATYIEPNFKYKAQFYPNDPSWNLQWGPRKIQADWAWNTTIGDHSILVAVVDTGIDWDHPDLAANYVPLGYDWVNNDADPMDDNGHGTHCAGIIAAALNNSIGVAGIAQVRIMAEKCLDNEGYGYSDALANGIIDAVNRGAHIISMSWGGYMYSETIYNAIKYAYNAGVLLVAAAGNDGISAKLYPAGYDEVIAVSATDSGDNVAAWSNFGDWIELAAPGVDIYSTMWNDRYIYLSGTSMACPHVSGVAALIWSQFPNKTRDWVRMQLRYTAVDKGALGFDIMYGYGRVNAKNAVEQVPPNHDLAIYYWKTPTYIEPSSEGTINATILNFGANNETEIEVQLIANGTVVNSTLIEFLPSSESMSICLGWSPSTSGKYNLTLYVIPVDGETSLKNNVVWKYIYVDFPLKAVVLSSAGNRLSDSTCIWDRLNVQWDKFGNTMIYIDYKTLDKEDIIYEDISATNADVLIISCAFTPEYGWEFTDSEIEAIKQYVFEGHGLIATAGTLYYMVPNNNKLATLFGLKENVVWNDTETHSLDIIEPSHPIFYKVPDPYNFPTVATNLPSDGVWDENELTNGSYIALGSSSESAIVVNKGLVYISPWLETIDPYTHTNHLQLLYNAIVWSYYPAHELTVSLDAPEYLIIDNSVLLNATVYNVGENDEENVLLQISINDTVVNSTIIPTLTKGSSYTITYLWTPTLEGTYNITAFAPPVSNERLFVDNMETILVKVGANRDIAVVNITSPSAVYAGKAVNVTVTVKNLGEFIESFNVILYRNTSIIDVIAVTDLYPNQEITLIFTWNTSDLTPCRSHMLWAEATLVPGEVNTDNNVLVFGLVKVKMRGDVDGDGTVTIFDVVIATASYESAVGDPYWNPDVDFAPPWGFIDIYDIVMITSVYEQSCTP